MWIQLKLLPNKANISKHDYCFADAPILNPNAAVILICMK